MIFISLVIMSTLNSVGGLWHALHYWALSNSIGEACYL